MQLCCRDANAHVIPASPSASPLTLPLMRPAPSPAACDARGVPPQGERSFIDAARFSPLPLGRGWLDALAASRVGGRTRNPLAGIAPARHEGDGAPKIANPMAPSPSPETAGAFRRATRALSRALPRFALL